MKSKDLIAHLQRLDPSGETEVCVGNVDIYFLSRDPAYYDGPLQVLRRDPALEGKQWNITGADMIRHGDKIQVHTVSIADMLMDMPDAEVGLHGCNDWTKELVEKWRKEAREP